MSQGERDCAESYLQPLLKTRLIRDLEYQVPVLLTEAKLRWVLDFKFYDNEIQEEVWADFKGFETERWMILKKLWPHYGPGLLRIYKGSGSRMRISEEINGPPSKIS